MSSATLLSLSTLRALRLDGLHVSLDTFCQFLSVSFSILLPSSENHSQAVDSAHLQSLWLIVDDSGDEIRDAIGSAAALATTSQKQAMLGSFVVSRWCREMHRVTYEALTPARYP